MLLTHFGGVFWVIMLFCGLKLALIICCLNGFAKSCDSSPSLRSLPLCMNLLFYHLQNSGDHHASLMVLITVLAYFYLCLTNVLLFDLETSYLDLLSTTSSSSPPVFNVCVLLPQSFSFYWQVCGFFLATLLGSPVSWSHLFTVDADTGVWQILFSAADSRYEPPTAVCAVHWME